MGWRRVIISAQQRAKGVDQDLKVNFEISFIAAGVPEGAAMFGKPAGAGEAFYFSPEASRIFGGELDAALAADCELPLEPDLDVVVGHPQARTLLLRA